MSTSYFDYPGHVLIAGASGGLGLALTETFLSEGFRNLICHYKSSSTALEDLFRRHDLKPSDHCLQADLTNEDQAHNMMKQAFNRFGRIWGLVNFVGTSNNAMSWKLTGEDFSQVFESNVLSTFLLCKALIPHLREKNGGRIINSSSIVAFTGAPGASHYAASKAAIVGFTKSLALELSSKSITANALALGYFNYGLITHVAAPIQETVKARTPLQRFGQINEVAGMIKFLLSHDGAFTTGQALHVNGGLY